jgi:hypothetical protein
VNVDQRGLVVVAPTFSIFNPPRRLDHHLAEFGGLKTSAAKDGRHHLVREQIFEAWLITAAISVSVHDSLLTREIVCKVTAKHVRFVTADRKFRGIA